MLHLEIFVPRKEKRSLWRHKFYMKERKLNKPRMFSQRASLIAQLFNNWLAKQETPVQFLGGEDQLEKR